jgi:hypothetical protein
MVEYFQNLKHINKIIIAIPKKTLIYQWKLLSTVSTVLPKRDSSGVFLQFRKVNTWKRVQSEDMGEMRNRRDASLQLEQEPSLIQVLV